MIDLWTTYLPHGIQLSCRSAGERGRPVLMFLHGFPEAAFVWDTLLDYFSQPEHGGYRCVAPNLRGYEHSSAPADVAAYRLKHLTDDLIALIGNECGGSGLAGLIAHDWGGAIAWSLASSRPELLERLVIINSPHPQTFLRGLKFSAAQQAASAYMNFLIRPDAQALLAEHDFARLWPFFDEVGVPEGQRHPSSSEIPVGAGWMTEAVKAQYRQIWRGDGSSPGAGLNGGLNYYRASPLRPPRDTDPAASGIELPPEAFTVSSTTLVLWAMLDTALPSELIEGLDQWVSDLTIVRIPNASHWVVHEQPGRIAEEISRFLG